MTPCLGQYCESKTCVTICYLYVITLSVFSSVLDVARYMLLQGD